MSQSGGQQSTPAAEIEITPDIVRRLLAEQHPDLAELELVEFAAGWDNVMFRLGPNLVIRLPRRALGAPLVEHEQEWLPVLAPRLPLPVPAPIRMGRPNDDYPWRWSVLPWFDGAPIGNGVWGRPDESANAMGQFLAALHTPAAENAPENFHRGGPLSARSENTLERIALLEGLGDMGGVEGIDAALVRSALAEASAADPWEGPPMWLHGDLHPFNLLQADGRPSAVIDFGDMCGGDPACDLAIAFSAFEPPQRPVLRQAANNAGHVIDDAMWLRARGWCLSIGVTLIAFSADNPAFQAMGRRMTTVGAGLA